ncbi:MAG: response regulator [Gammaproteobacteria bacterium]|nr:response regulator [Gammaproteobacteria bacterium]
MAALQKTAVSDSENTGNGKQSVSAPADSLRLPIQRLDQIAAAADELQIAQVRIEKHQADGRRIAELSQQLRRYWLNMRAENSSTDKWGFSGGTELILNLETISQQMDAGIRSTSSLVKLLATNLQENVHELRLVPVESILSPLERVVWELAQSEKKRVELVLEGGQLEMDRLVLEKIRDPLIHLLRNAVDHGIETPEERVKAGKNEVGKIRISLAREGGNVNLTIRDDGAGIDLNAIREQALKYEMATKDELYGLSREELVEYIFRPGFSSRSNVSEISGRGVGLDVVRSNLQMLKGHVSASFTEKQGTVFLLTIPFTMATEFGLFIKCSNQEFAIPAQYIKRIMEVSLSDIINLESRQAILVDGQPVPLQSLSQFLGLVEEKEMEDEFFKVVIIHSGWRQMAVIVNHIVEEQEMVVKSLKPPLNDLANISGGTVGSDGRVILVLDIQDLLGQKHYRAPVTLKPEQAVNANSKKILVVDDSITTRTLEVSILERLGYDVQSAVSAEDALEKLQAENFNLLITDVEMPGKSGFELTQQVRGGLGLTDLPVIIVTSLSSDEDRKKGLEVKADAYIVKSEFESKELVNTVALLI